MTRKQAEAVIDALESTGTMEARYAFGEMTDEEVIAEAIGSMILALDKEGYGTMSK